MCKNVTVSVNVFVLYVLLLVNMLHMTVNKSGLAGDYCVDVVVSGSCLLICAFSLDDSQGEKCFRPLPCSGEERGL